ncbi:hypothetical protein C8R46DRAFT_1209191 [Mycena filopes]|nr:hypothetical protein C8R46DRAFT_1209191 [Mycena filopes]
MKTEEKPDDPVDAAMATLTDALTQAKRALAARDEPLATLRKQCRELQDKVATLENAAITQTQALVDECALRTAADKRSADLATQVKEERVALIKEREGLKVVQKDLEKKNAALKEGQAQLKAVHTKLLADKHATVSNFKRSLAEMEGGGGGGGMEEEERLVTPTAKKRKSDAVLARDLAFMRALL